MLEKFLKGYYFTNVFIDCLLIQILVVIRVILRGVVFGFLPPELDLIKSPRSLLAKIEVLQIPPLALCYFLAFCDWMQGTYLHPCLRSIDQVKDIFLEKYHQQTKLQSSDLYGKVLQR